MPYSEFFPDERATVAFGARLARACGAGALIFLRGELGTGKTTLVRGMLRGLGHEGVVKSPTYTLVEPYRLGERWVYHFDLYRVSDPEELEYFGAREYFDAGALCLVEWPEQGRGFLPEPDLIIVLAYLNHGRQLRLSAHTDRGAGILGAIETTRTA